MTCWYLQHELEITIARKNRVWLCRARSVELRLLADQQRLCALRGGQNSAYWIKDLAGMSKFFTRLLLVWIVSQSGSLGGCTNSCTVTTEGTGTSERWGRRQEPALPMEPLAKHWLGPRRHLGLLLPGIPLRASAGGFATATAAETAGPDWLEIACLFTWKIKFLSWEWKVQRWRQCSK